MVLSVITPSIQIKPINATFFGELSKSQIIGRAVTDSLFQYNLQSSYQ